MEYIFNTGVRRRVHSTNRIVFSAPSLHPTRLLHQHDIFYIIDGSFKVCVEDVILDAHRGSVLILPANLWHKGLEPCAPGTQTLWVLMETEEGDALSPLSHTDLSPDQLALPFCIDASQNPAVFKLFERILYSHINDEQVRSSAYADLLLCELYDTHRSTDIHLALAEKIRQMIDINLHINLSNAQIAQSLGRSVKNVENTFKEYYHTTIHQYQIRKRLEKCRISLEYFPTRPIREIAAEMNFYDEYHFSRQFKKHYGLSPSEYKKKFFSQNRTNFIPKK